MAYSKSLWKCKRCNFIAKSPCFLFKHLERERSCDPFFSNESCDSLITELEEFVYGRKSFKCRICDNYYSSVKSRHTHERKYHPDVRVVPIQPRINAFLNENKSHITNDSNFIKQCISRKHIGFLELAKKIHFDVHYPENNNLKVTNKASLYIRYYNGRKWKYEQKHKVISTIIDECYYIMKAHYESGKNDDIDQWMLKIDSLDRKTLKSLGKDLFSLIHKRIIN